MFIIVNLIGVMFVFVNEVWRMFFLYWFCWILSCVTFTLDIRFVTRPLVGVSSSGSLINFCNCWGVMICPS